MAARATAAAAAAGAGEVKAAAAATVATGAGDHNVLGHLPDGTVVTMDHAVDMMVSMHRLKTAAGRCTLGALNALAHLAETVSASDGHYSLSVVKRDPIFDAGLVKCMLGIADKSAGFPEEKMAELKRKILKIPDETSTISPERRVYVCLFEMRHLLKHMGLRIEDVMETMEEIAAAPRAAATAASAAPGAAGAGSPASDKPKPRASKRKKR
jgi:hypothetical protein